FLQTNMTAIISRVSCSTFYLLLTQQTACKLLHLSLVSAFCAESSATLRHCNTFRLRDKGDNLLNVIVDILLKLNFEKLTVLVDDSSSETDNKVLLQRLSDHFIRIRLHRVDSDLHRIFASETTSYKHSYYLLLMEPDLVLDVLTLASKFDFPTNKFYWIIVSSDGVTHSMFPAKTSLSAVSQNVLIIRKTWNRSDNISCRYHMAVKTPMTLTDAYIADAVLLLTNTVAQLMRTNRISVATTKSNFTEKVRDHILQQSSTGGVFVSVSFDSSGFSTNTDYTLYSVERSGGGGVVTEKKAATWNHQRGLTILSSLFPLEPSGFGNVSFLVGVLLTEPYTMVRRGRYLGLCVDILKQLSETLQFRYQLVNTSSLASGNREQNGSWNGLIGMLLENKLNLSIGPFTLTEEREEVVDFTVPFAVEKRGILLKRSERSSTDEFRMLRPFQMLLWVALAGIIVLVSVLLTVINRFKRDDPSLTAARSNNTNNDNTNIDVDGSNNTNNDNTNIDVDGYRITSNFWMLFTYHMQQVVINEPRTIPARIFVGFWWLFIILLINYYTATLAAILTIPINVSPITSLAQLAQPHSQYKPVAIFDSSTYGTFANSNKTVDHRILTTMKELPRVRNSTTAVRLILEDQYAFIAMMSQLEYLKSFHCEDLTIIPDDTYVYQVGFILPKNSIYTRRLSYGIRKLQEAGLIEKWKHKWFFDSKKCSQDGPASDPLGLRSLAGPYFIYLGFVGLGFIILVAEGAYTVYSKRVGRPTRNNNDI
ncbi:glutamate receptor ionotropic, delta-2-like, partial, partial [Argonauta hians]